jgi:hypothetical protein
MILKTIGAEPGPIEPYLSGAKSLETRVTDYHSNETAVEAARGSQ